jgi:hypothetical protein
LDESVPATIDLDDLGLDTGAHLLLDRALGPLAPGQRLRITGHHPVLALQVRAWCRSQGHRFVTEADGLTVERGTADSARWSGAVRAGEPTVPAAQADRVWGLAARGALVQAGGPELSVDWVDRDLVWADVAPKLYANALANQWDPATAVDWTAPSELAPDIEGAVVQVMTYLVENEQAALILPARLLSRLHPHFREVMQLLAAQVADEARHVEIFNRRALLHREQLGVSTADGRASLQTLLGENDFTMAAFLLSVLGEGTFLDLLRFLNLHAPDPVTAEVTRLAGRDEARHVAFGVAHTAHVVRADPHFLTRLRSAVERRHAVLSSTAGLNQHVFDALVLLAAGSWEASAIRRGWAAVQQLQHDMDDGRRRRLATIGFTDDEAAEISALHTRNFM